jgi:hypothetical protein
VEKRGGVMDIKETMHPCVGCMCSYSSEGKRFRDRMGYCPIVDKYFDADKQEVYEESKRPKGKGRVGQQKQRKR